MLKACLWCPLEMNRQEFYFIYHVRNETVLLVSWWCYPHPFSLNVSFIFLYISEWAYTKEEAVLGFGGRGFFVWFFTISTEPWGYRGIFIMVFFFYLVCISSSASGFLFLLAQIILFRNLCVNKQMPSPKHILYLHLNVARFDSKLAVSIVRCLGNNFHGYFMV